MSENIDSSKNDFLELIHQQGLKIYHIGDTLYVAKSCDKGREVKDIIAGGWQHELDESDGYCKKWVPTIKEPHEIYYSDGGIEFVEEFNFKFIDKIEDNPKNTEDNNMVKRYPTLKINALDPDFISSEITLDGNKIPGLRGIEISARLPDEPIYTVKFEILAKLDIETLADVHADTVVYIENVKYKLVPCEEK